MFVAAAFTAFGLIWFVIAQRRPDRTYTVLPPATPEASGAAEATPDEATPDEATGENENAVNRTAADEGDLADAEVAGTGTELALDPSSASAGEADGTGSATSRSED